MPIAAALSSLRTGNGLKGQLLRGGLGSFAVKAISTLLNLGLAILLARLLGVDGFGLYSFVYAVIIILAIPAQMGLPNLIMRETARAHAQGRWALMKGLWRWGSLMALGVSAVLIVCVLIFLWVFANTPSQAEVFYWGVALIPLIALGNLRGAALRGLRHVVQGQLPEFVMRPAFFIGLIVSVYLIFSTQTLTAANAMMFHAIASLIAFALGAAMLWRARPAELAAETKREFQWRSWLASTIPLAMTQGTQIINQRIGLIVLGIFASSADVGMYRVALQGSTLVMFGLSAISTVIAPHFARLYTQGDEERLRRLVTLSARASLLVALPICAIYIFLGREVISLLFGSEFAGSYHALVILAFGQLFNSAAGTAGTLLNMTGHERIVFTGILCSALANLALSIALIPAFGLEGAAVASVASLVIWNVMLTARAWQRLHIDGTIFGMRAR